MQLQSGGSWLHDQPGPNASLHPSQAQAGEVFHPIVYAFGREITAGPILFAMSVAYAGGSAVHALPVCQAVRPRLG